MPERVDLIKIIQALEAIGCEVCEIRKEPDSARARLCIVVWPCTKKED